MKTLFVNISDTMVFKVDFKEIDGLWDKMGDFTYFEFSFVLPPKTILNISNDGSEFIDAMYVDRTKIMPKAEGVMEIAIHDVTKSDGGNYTVAIYVPRKILIMVFMVYVLGRYNIHSVKK